MAEGWIKMRAHLITHPKVVAMANHLQSFREFRDWLTPGGGSAMNGQVVSVGALRRVTTCALLSVWSEARAHGEWEGDDLRLPYNTITDLDEMAGVPGIGDAMLSVGWVVENDAGGGITLPRFKSYCGSSNAERQSEYRARNAPARNEHTNARCNNVTTRSVSVSDSVGSSSKGESEGKPSGRRRAPYTPEFESAWDAYPPTGKHGKATAAKAWTKAVDALVAEGQDRDGAVAVLMTKITEYAASDKGRGAYCGHMATWLNGRSWEADPEAWRERKPAPAAAPKSDRYKGQYPEGVFNVPVS